ncbi:hypothetical protein CBL_00109 [Carabus blaptoides fortunei]
MIRTVIIFVLIVPAIFHLLTQDNNENHALDLANLAKDIFDRECQTCGTILIITNTNDITQNLFHANISLSRKDATVLSLKVENFSSFQIGKSQDYFPDMTILFINEENSEGVKEIIFAIELEPFWYIRGKFLVIASGLVNIGDDWIMEVFQSFWSRQALNVLLQRHAVVMSEEQVYKLKLNSPNKMRPSFHVMKESALPTIKGYIIRKDKFYYEEILEVMGWICQAGLDIYWRNRNYELEDNTTTRKESFELDDGYQPINMEHLQPAFILLACGLVLATMVFACEMIVRPCKNGRNQKIVNTFMGCDEQPWTENWTECKKIKEDTKTLNESVGEKFIENDGRSEMELRDKEDSAKSRGTGDREEQGN